MFQIQMADTTVQINNRYQRCKQHCQEYLLSDCKKPDITVEVSAKEIDTFVANATSFGIEGLSKDGAEIYCVHELIYRQLPLVGAFWLHAVAVEMDGVAYAFSAPSGYGKTTHAKLWLKQFPDRARIINGDNPVFRKIGNDYHAYGTPFCGKERYQVKTHAPLRGLCYLKHSTTNHIQRQEPGLVFGELVRGYQNLFSQENQSAYLTLLQDFAETVPVYQLCCNMDPEAAQVAYQGMKL